MTTPTPAVYRAAVEARLRERARRLGVPTYVVRRQAALERLAARLSKVAPERWALKGGFAGNKVVEIDILADPDRLSRFDLSAIEP